MHRRVQSDLPQLNIDERAVNVVWPSGNTNRFYHMWLRDHCRCPQCFHQQTMQRLVDTFAIPKQIAPQNVQALPEGLLIEWPGETPHTTRFPWNWLHRHAYGVRAQNNTNSLTFRSSGLGQASEGYSKVLWGSSIESSPPQVDFEAVMHSDEALLQWLNKIDQYGFCFVAGVPENPEETEALVRRIAFIRETHYGGFWDFTSDLAHGDTAYTDIALGAHTDTTYFTDPAGLQLFHLLSHTAGGDRSLQGKDLGGASLLVDGFFVANFMHDVFPEQYEVLRSTPISTHSAGDQDTLIKPLMVGYPIVQHDPVNNDLVMIRYNNSDRSTLSLPEDKVEPFYEALRCWHNIVTDKESEYWFRLRPGMALSAFPTNQSLITTVSSTVGRHLSARADCAERISLTTTTAVALASCAHATKHLRALRAYGKTEFKHALRVMHPSRLARAAARGPVVDIHAIHRYVEFDFRLGLNRWLERAHAIDHPVRQTRAPAHDLAAEPVKVFVAKQSLLELVVIVFVVRLFICKCNSWCNKAFLVNRAAARQTAPGARAAAADAGDVRRRDVLVFNGKDIVTQRLLFKIQIFIDIVARECKQAVAERISKQLIINKLIEIGELRRDGRRRFEQVQK